MKKIITIALVIILSSIGNFKLLAQEKEFVWPDGKKMAISLTWDDGRESQVKSGIPILDKFDVKATFYIIPSATLPVKEEWKQAVQSGHEIANHSIYHPCSGNFLWARPRALESYSIDKIQNELLEANKLIEDLYGVKVDQFAYPCGQTFVGRGEETKSYVPVIAKNFVSGRTWLNEAANDPSFCDLSQITGVEMDNKSFEEIKLLIDTARKDGLWLVLAGHDIGDNKEQQTTQIKMLNQLLPYLKANSNDIWTAPVGEIAKYIVEKRDF